MTNNSNLREMTSEEVKKCSLGVLDYIDKVCNENGLKYFLAGGTLLGAVRHQGFIPWDDDIDIYMPRADYERLFDVWPKDSQYKALNHNNTMHYPYSFGKVIDTRTLKIEPVRKSYQVIGVDVDVFPYDNLPNDDAEAEAFYEQIAKYQKRLNRHIEPFHGGKNWMTSIYHFIRIFINRFIELISFNSVEKIVSHYCEYAQRYHNNETDYYGMTGISHYGIKEKILKENYETLIKLPFEGKEYPAPIGYKTYLSNLYGKDYMQLPPPEMRKTHHSFKAYWK